MHQSSPAPRVTATLAGILALGTLFQTSCAFPEAADGDSDTSTDTDTDTGRSAVFPESSVPLDREVDVPVDQVIRVRFSEHLDGRFVGSSDVLLSSGSVYKLLSVYYEPVARELVAWPTSPMRMDGVWVFSIEGGLRGLDGTLVAPEEVMSFRTGSASSGNTAFEKLNYSSDIKPLLDARCASCHSPAGGHMSGVDLSSEAGLTETVLQVTSGQWPSWKRIVPGEPARSYLLFKLLGDGTASGRQMPRTLDDKPAVPLTVDEQRQVSDWIVNGALF